MLKEEKHLAALIEKAHRKTVRDKWHRGGKFSGIKPLSSGDKGQIMETFAIYLAGQSGYNSYRNPKERDRLQTARRLPF